MTTLRLSENNPAPDIHKDGFVETPDAFSIRYAIFRTTGPVLGTILLLQGRNESIEKYFETISDFVARDYDVIAFDWRGQGLSTRFFAGRDVGYVDSFDQYATDLETIFTQVVLPDCRPPFFIVAHSMGALTALYCAPALTNRVRRMVLNAPFLGLGVSQARQDMMRLALPALDVAGLGATYLSGGPAARLRKPFEINNLTTDPQRYARNIALVAREDDLALGGPGVRWMRAAFRAMARVRSESHMARTTIPILTVMDGADTVVSNAAIEEHVAKLRAGFLLTIDGARHEIMQEADAYREQFLAAVAAFIPGSPEMRSYAPRSVASAAS